MLKLESKKSLATYSVLFVALSESLVGTVIPYIMKSIFQKQSAIKGHLSRTTYRLAQLQDVSHDLRSVWRCFLPSVMEIQRGSRLVVEEGFRRRK